MHLLTLIVLAPFIAAMVIIALPDRARAATRLVAITGAGVSLAGAIATILQYDLARGGLQMQKVVPLVPSLGISYAVAVDGWSLSLLLLTGIILFAGCWASWTVKDRDRDFYVLLLVLSAGVFGVFVSLDMFVFFLFYEIAVLPMYLLIGIWGSTKKVEIQGPLAPFLKRLDIGGREYAAMKLTLMLLMGSAFILVGILALYMAGGGKTFNMELLRGNMVMSRDTQLWVFPALWVGFGTLAGLFPFHTWSPDGHAAAPTAVSMLHAGVLMKLGAFGVIRVGMVMLPEGAQAWALVVGIVASINVVYGAFSAMSQKDLKYIIAYSSVSHMGVVMLGAATLTVSGWNGAVFQMFAHGIMTGAFFALVGLIYEKSHTRDVASMGGFAKFMPGISVVFTLGCLSSLGLPGTAGFVAEFLVFLGAYKSAHGWWMLPGILGAFITAIYVLKATRQIFWGPFPEGRFEHLEDARGTEWVAISMLAVCLVLFGFWPNLALTGVDKATVEYLSRVVGTSVAAAGPALVP
ncbi:MAG: NADH-quinone oxidoreductase subunit M [Deltaproteobacteria bacterium]|nr:NADH-quinone oxidoreductase subunit M [Deltaproteobacteria bacterium]